MSLNRTLIRRIGIAGHMGAGKSTCAGYFAHARLRIIDGDREAKLLVSHDEAIKQRLALTFGASVITGGSVDFRELGKAAFASVQSMRTLNAIVHPALVQRLKDMVFDQSAPCVLDAALIPPWGIDSWFDLCLWVTASPQIRRARVLAKTGLSPDQISIRMSVQESLIGVPTGDRWLHVENEGSLDDLETRLNEIIAGRTDRPM